MTTPVALAPIPFLQVTEGGSPVSGALIFTYAAGTSVKQTTYQDSAGTIPNSNPIVCDANGVCIIQLQQGLNYDLVISPANDTDPPTNQFYRYSNIAVSNISLLTANPYAIAGGTSDNITASYSVSNATLTDGYVLKLRITTPNTTTNPVFAPTLNGALQTTHTIVKVVENTEVPLAISDLQGDVTLIYNLSNTVWRLQYPNSSSIFAPSVALTAAATTNIGNAGSTNITINGNTTITAFDTVAEGTLRLLHFTGTPGITYNVTSMQTLGAVSRTYAAGDTSLFRSLGGGNWIEEMSSNFVTNATNAVSATNATNPAIRSYLTGLTLSNNGAQGGTCSFATNQMTVVGAVSSGAYAVGQSIEAAGVAAGTYISAGVASPYTLSTSPGTIGTEWVGATNGIMSIAAGQCTDSTLTHLINVAAMTKTSAAWVAGSGNGGIDTGAIAASTWYYFFAIYNPTTLASDIIFSLSSSTPALPSGFTLYRYIGGALSDANKNWIHFTQMGRDFYWSTPILDVNVVGNVAAQLATLTIPLGRKMKVLGAATQSTTAATPLLYISDPSSADLTPSVSTAPLTTVPAVIGGTGGAQFSVWSNITAQVRWKCTDVSVNVLILTLGWIDLADSQL